MASDGGGDYVPVKAAIDAAPAGRTEPWAIFIENGIYYEKDTIPASKPFLHLVGEGMANTIISYNAATDGIAPKVFPIAFAEICQRIAVFACISWCLRPFMQ